MKRSIIRTIAVAALAALTAGCGVEKYLPGSDAGADLPPGLSDLGRTCIPEHPVNYCPDVRGVFKQPVKNLEERWHPPFLSGNRVFNANWVPAPALNDHRDGLGPVFSATACSGCHIRNGRGRPPVEDESSLEFMVMRLSVPGAAAGDPPRPHPVYGGQLADKAIPGVAAEGQVRITYEEISGRFADGETYQLRKPSYSITDLAYGPLGDEVMISPRVAPAVIGGGLLEAISAQTLLDLADPDDSDGDGISGRVNWARDPVDGKRKIGRFGWKAGAVTLRHQTATALIADMGVTSRYYGAQDCPRGQDAEPCQLARAGGQPEIAQQDFEDLMVYMELLGVTGRRYLDDPTVQRGEKLFATAGCAACHTPVFQTGTHPKWGQLSNRRIEPYTDLLLHDMGEELADGTPEGEAFGSEWRTPTLWGIGLTKLVSEHSFFLHDGRARNLTEAILWHGGEAEASKEAFRTLPKADREAMIAFLESL